MKFMTIWPHMHACTHVLQAVAVTVGVHFCFCNPGEQKNVASGMKEKHTLQRFKYKINSKLQKVPGIGNRLGYPRPGFAPSFLNDPEQEDTIPLFKHDNY